MTHGKRILECVALTPRWTKALVRFFRALAKNGDSRLFHPHPATARAIDALARRRGKDLYCVLVEGGDVLGYGMLRGWNEGYEIPGLGIAIHPSARGSGLGKLLMQYLHISAARKGAARVRLRVLRDNAKAIRLYENLGYVFEKGKSGDPYLTGFKTLSGRP